jgi:folate-binding protein YgfZ
VNEAYQAALTSAAVFDRSTVGKLSLIGPDAVPFLHNLCTNDIKSLKVGQGCEAYLCDPRAKVLHQFWVDRTAEGLRLETVPGRDDTLFKALDRYLISEQLEITNETGRLKQFHVAGTIARPMLKQHFNTAMPKEEFSHIAINTTLIRHRNILGVEGFDLIGGDIALSLPVGDEATYETLRIEAGSPEYGKDIDDTRFVMELPNAARAVSFTKGCFPGQEPIVMARDRAGFVNRAFLGLKVLEGGPIPHGTKLTRDGQEVGIVTSSTFSPRLNAPLAIGYVKRGHQERGTKLQAGDQPVEILGYPPLAGI